MRAAALGALLLAGCIEIPDPIPAACQAGEDGDADGWACDGIVADCDDGDPTIHPGALDIVDDDIDQDCLSGDRAAAEAVGEVSIDEAGLVTTPQIRLELDAVGSGFPASIIERSTGIELAYQGSDAERGLGISIYPELNTSQQGNGTTTVAARGPAYGEATIAWSWNGGPQVTGTTRLRFLPDGRIFRNDEVELDAEFPAAAEPHFFASFASFEESLYSHFDWEGNDLGPVPLGDVAQPFPFVGDDSSPGWMCWLNASGVRQVGWAWQPRGGLGPRATIAGAADDVRLAFEYDWARMSSTVPAGTYQAATVLVFGPVSDGMCWDTISAAIDAYDPVELAPTLGGGAVDGFDPDGGAYLVSSDDAFVELRVQDAPARRGLLILAELGVDTAAGVTVWHDRQRMQRGVDFLVQPGPGAAVSIWIGRLFDSGDVIRIAAPGGEE